MTPIDHERNAQSGPSLDREQIVPDAREPVEQQARPGWGAWEPGPLTQDEEAPVMEVIEVAADPAREVSIDPTRSSTTGVFDPLANPTAGDFRKEPQNAGE